MRALPPPRLRRHIDYEKTAHRAPLILDGERLREAGERIKRGCYRRARRIDLEIVGIAQGHAHRLIGRADPFEDDMRRERAGAGRIEKSLIMRDLSSSAERTPPI
jgi:hypothetical protein